MKILVNLFVKCLSVNIVTEQGDNLVEAEIWILKDNGYTSPFPA